jgi:YkoY family integral membrane protein
MIELSFALSDVPRIITLSFLEILLSADNAVVLGVLSHTLPKHLRKKALYIGLASSIFLRAGALLTIALLLKSLWVQLLGGAYLLYLSIRYFTKKRKLPETRPAASFWKVVLLIELLDLVFAIDSIVAGLAFINADLSKIWIVYFGGIIGVAGMRYAAGLFGSLLTQFPNLEKSAYLMVGWIGIKLALLAFSFHIPTPLFWSVIALLFTLGFFGTKR